LDLEIGNAPFELSNSEKSKTSSRELFISFHETKRRPITRDRFSHRFWDHTPSCGSGLSIRIDQRGFSLRRKRTCKRQGHRQGEIKWPCFGGIYREERKFKRHFRPAAVAACLCRQPLPARSAGGAPSTPRRACESGAQQGVARQCAAWTCRLGWVTVERQGFTGSEGLGTTGLKTLRGVA